MRQTKNGFFIRKNSTLPEHQHPLQDETLVLFLKIGRQKRGINQIHPQDDGTAELLGDVVNHLGIDSGSHDGRWLIFQLFSAIVRSHPSGMSPSKKGKSTES